MVAVTAIITITTAVAAVDNRSDRSGLAAVIASVKTAVQRSQPEAANRAEITRTTCTNIIIT